MKIVYLPPDERPCNFFAAAMSEGNAEYTLAVPPKEILGDKKIPAEYEKIERFLLRECADADALVLSADMLLYGGMVPSRLHAETEEEGKARLSLLPRLKARNKKLKLYVFALVMRCPRYSSDDEEPLYYGTCGREIFLTGVLEHRRLLGEVTEEEYAKERAKLGEKTGPYLADYLARRAVNLSLLKELSRMRETVDTLIVPQDDSAPLGYTALDRKALFGTIAREDGELPLNYPGADEVGSVLVARAVNEGKGLCPRVAPVYASEEGKRGIPLYEDRPLEETVAAQIEAAGCRMSDADGADILLFVNVAAGAMKDISSGEGYGKRDLAPFVSRMAEEIGRGRRVALADVAWCNGGDAELLRLLSERVSLFSLASYAGWNTSSNSLGTALAQASLRFACGDTPAHRRFLAERFYEDVGYCGHVRKLVCEKYLPALGLDYFHADGKRGRAAEIVKRELEGYIGELLPEVAQHYGLAGCEMPWRRMFEVGLRAVEK